MKINYKKILKRSIYVVLSIFIILTALIFSLRIPAVQNFVKDRLIIYLEKKIKTDVELERVYIDFPNRLVMDHLFLQGEDVDTLLYTKKLDVGLDILQLLKSKADLKSIYLEGTRANVVRRNDGTFNFDYIINAFATKEEKESPSKPFIISLDKIKLKDVGVSFIDQQAGNNIKIAIQNFDTRVKTFDLDQNSYAIDKIALDGLKLRLKQDLVKEVAQKVEEKVDSLNQKKPMQLSLGEIDLKNFDIDYGDDQTKVYAQLKFKSFSTLVKKIDINANDFQVDGIELEGLRLKFNQKLINDIQQNNVDVKSTVEPLKLGLNTIHLKDIKIDYGDDRSKTFAKIDLEEAKSKINRINLADQIYDIENILLKNTTVDARLHLASSNNPSNITPTPSKKSPMQIVLSKGVLDGVKVIYRNTAERPTNQGLDVNNLNISHLALDIRDFKMFDGQFTGKVKKGELKEAKGLNIQRLETNFLYAHQQAYLKNLFLQTPRTLLRDEIILSYPSAQHLSNNLGNVSINARLRNSKLSFADVLFLVPSLRQTTPFKEYPSATLQLNTQLKGKINDLTVNYLQLQGLDDLKIDAAGKIQNLMDPNRLTYDLNIKNFSTSSKTIYKLVPKNTIPNNIRIPSHLAVKGKAKGSLKKIDTQLQLTSTLGNLDAEAKIDLRQQNKEIYDIKANLQKVDIGTLISNKELGKVTGNFAIKGNSLDFEQASASIKGQIQSASYKNYTYQKINLDALIKQGAFEAHLTSNDPNANLNLTASGLYKKDLSNIKLNGDVVKLDLNKLGFYASPMILAGGIQANFDNLDVDQLNGELKLENFALSDSKEIFPLQDIQLQAISTSDSNRIQLNSQLIDAELKGKYKITQIFGSLAQTMNQYYQFQNSTIETIYPNQYFQLDAKIKDDDLIRKFVPELKEFETITLVAAYQADTKKIEIDADLPQLKYGNNSINDVRLDLNNQGESLIFDANVAGLSNENFQLKNINLNGDIANNIIQINAASKNDEGIDQFLVAGQIKALKDWTEINLLPNGLILNAEPWVVDPNNQLRILKDGFVAKNFKLTNNGSSIEIQSENDLASSPLNLTIKNFKIETITELIKKEDLPASGVIDGTAKIQNLTSNMTFLADINVTDLVAFNNPVGNLHVNAENKSADIIQVNVELTGNNNEVNLNGEYNTKASSFDLALNLNRLEMKSLQGFTMNMLKDTEGYLSGKLDLKGSIDKPEIRGKLQFNEVGLTVAEYGSNFRHLNDSIYFTSKGIEFNRFKINDADGNALTLDGDILTETYRDFAFDLRASARDFKVVNAEKSNDALTYGILAINANLTIGGNLDLPVINGSITVTDNTNFTFVLPQNSPSLQAREGIVEFIDQDQIALQETLVKESIPSETKIKGFNVSVNIEVDKEAKTSIIIDKVNGDFVELQGEAQLTGGIDPSGKTNLTGVYQVEKGAYELSVSLLKRRFDIQKGSTITWTGEPTKANLDITAVYKTNAAPIDLVEQQLVGLSSSESNQYKQRIPFNTELKLTGELLKPIINFDITLNVDNPSISTTVLDNTKSKLDQLRNDEAEMNKQVFALLLLNRFVGENPFQSQSGVSAETLAKQSVSNILSQQLNNLAADLIEGVDIDFGIETQDDYTTGAKNTRTDLNVAVSKRLLDDRLKVTVGSNFGLEGDARQNENTNNIAGDITVEYALSRDGRYMIRAYRKNEYQVALQGQIIETGVGFIITLDYDKFKEIFEKKRRNRNFRRNQKIEAKP